jgi:hypothetical protein
VSELLLSAFADRPPNAPGAVFFWTHRACFQDLAFFPDWDRRRIAAERIALFRKQGGPATVNVANELATQLRVGGHSGGDYS